MRVGVLFVCLGNICRSPAAQGIFEALVAKQGLADQIRVDSAGTATFNVGKSPDPRSIDAMDRAGFDIRDQIARQISDEDYQTHQYIIAMDRANLMNCEAWKPKGYDGEVKLIMEYLGPGVDKQVPDPYYADPEAFDGVVSSLTRASEALLAYIIKQHSLKTPRL